MGIRRNAWWQQRLDERILDDESWSIPEVMVLELPIETTENHVKDRCRVLADADFVDVEMSESWMVQLTGEGKRYLEGEYDVDLYPAPQSPQSLDDLYAVFKRG